MSFPATIAFPFKMNIYRKPPRKHHVELLFVKFCAYNIPISLEKNRVLLVLLWICLIYNTTISLELKEFGSCWLQLHSSRELSQPHRNQTYSLASINTMLCSTELTAHAFVVAQTKGDGCFLLLFPVTEDVLNGPTGLLRHICLEYLPD